MAAGSMELNAKLQEQLALRVRKRRDELQRKAAQFLHAREEEEFGHRERKPMGIMEELKTIMARRGFLTNRLKLEDLTVLQRWHTQLQLLEVDARNEDDTEDWIADSIEGQDDQTAMKKALRLLTRDQFCFDVDYVASIRIADLKETLFDASEQQTRASEALTFSTTRHGYTMRVVLFTLDSSTVVHARTSLFVDDLDARLQSLNNHSVKELIDCLWDAVNG